MADTTYTSDVTAITADTMNDLNRLHYTIFGDPADKATARRTLLDGMDKITNSLGADVALNNTANYFDGPSIAQGTAGTWWVSGTITVVDTAAAQIRVKLWDGTTVIASTVVTVETADNPKTVSLSGYIASPAGNLRMSARDVSTVNGNIKFNSSGESKDSTISAIRIA